MSMDNLVSTEESTLMWKLANKIFPINRSLTGEGVRQTLNILGHQVSNLHCNEVTSGTKVFDWVVPDEWKINEAYILCESGNKIIDFQENNLHVIGYSAPINKYISLEDLLPKNY